MGIVFPNSSIETVSQGASSVMNFSAPFRNNPVQANYPAWYVKVNTGKILTGTTINWNITVFDNSNDFTATTFTAPIAGYYWAHVWLMSENDGTNTNDYYSLRKNNNNSSFDSVLRVYSTSGSAHHKQWPGGRTFYLDVGDNLRVYVDRMDDSNGGLYANSDRYTAFSGCYLGA